MDNNTCNVKQLEAAGYEAHCGVQHADNGHFRACDGDCVEGRCQGHRDL